MLNVRWFYFAGAERKKEISSLVLFFPSSE